jgi:hypothetical protein
MEFLEFESKNDKTHTIECPLLILLLKHHDNLTSDLRRLNKYPKSECPSYTYKIKIGDEDSLHKMKMASRSFNFPGFVVDLLLGEGQFQMLTKFDPDPVFLSPN